MPVKGDRMRTFEPRRPSPDTSAGSASKESRRGVPEDDTRLHGKCAGLGEAVFQGPCEQAAARCLKCGLLGLTSEYAGLCC